MDKSDVNIKKDKTLYLDGMIIYLGKFLKSTHEL